jgi:hypothetical protein
VSVVVIAFGTLVQFAVVPTSVVVSSTAPIRFAGHASSHSVCGGAIAPGARMISRTPVKSDAVGFEFGSNGSVPAIEKCPPARNPENWSRRKEWAVYPPIRRTARVTRPSASDCPCEPCHADGRKDKPMTLLTDSRGRGRSPRRTTRRDH